MIFDEQGIELGDEIIIRREILQTGVVLVVSMDRWLIYLFFAQLDSILLISMAT